MTFLPLKFMDEVQYVRLRSFIFTMCFLPLYAESIDLYLISCCTLFMVLVLVFLQVSKCGGHFKVH